MDHNVCLLPSPKVKYNLCIDKETQLNTYQCMFRLADYFFVHIQSRQGNANNNNTKLALQLRLYIGADSGCFGDEIGQF